MCGLFGAIGKYDTGVVKGLAILNESRGKQSAGLFNGKESCKRASTATVMLREDVDDVMFGTTIICGHTRFATMGGVTTENAHPFRVGNIVGAHNGVLFNEAKIAKENGLTYTVDSEVIFQMLAKGGIKTLKDIRGSMAIWWWDKSDPSAVRLCRNSGNPLHFVKTDKAIYFSSESDHLSVMLGKNAKVEKIDEDKLYRITPDLEIHTKEIEVGEAYTSVVTSPTISHPREDGWRWIQGIWVLDASLSTRGKSTEFNGNYEYYHGGDTVSDVVRDNGPFYRCWGCLRTLNEQYDVMQYGRSDDKACNYCGFDLKSAEFLPPVDWEGVCGCDSSTCDICYAADEYEAAVLLEDERKEEEEQERAELMAKDFADDLNGDDAPEACETCGIVGCAGCLEQEGNAFTACKRHGVVGCVVCKEQKDTDITQEIIVGDDKPMFQPNLYQRLTQGVRSIANANLDI